MAHISELKFPFKAEIAAPVAGFEVGDAVTVTAYDHEPHTYMVKAKGKSAVGGVAAEHLNVDPDAEMKDPEPALDPQAEARKRNEEAEELARKAGEPVPDPEEDEKSWPAPKGESKSKDEKVQESTEQLAEDEKGR